MDVQGREAVRDAPDAAGETPVTPLWRARELALSPVQVAWGAESGDEGPMRLIRHEHVSEGDHQRGH